MTEHQERLVYQILELLDTACQGCLELMDAYSNDETAYVKELLDNLWAVTNAVRSAQEPILPLLEHAYSTEMLENVEDTLDDIECSVGAGEHDRSAMKMEFQLFPFLRQLKEMFYFFGLICPNEGRMQQYYQDEFAEHYQNFYVSDTEPASCRLSIVIPAYNHLETTKYCVEQLLKETDFEKLDAELIFIDHGSTDGTLEYLESLGIGKVIHFKHNVRMYMFTTLFQVCQGEFFCFVSNDILVTRDWADILLACLQSDSNIISAVPATPNISNFQSAKLKDAPDEPDAFVAWANSRNCFDSAQWDDRARLMPPIGMFRTSLVNQIGFADPYFYSMEYWDDDLSLRARRAGYRQVLCNNVACYHFGSVTGREAQKQEGTLNYGQELFKKKNGVDAWAAGCFYDAQAMEILKRVIPLQKDSAAILGLDCGFGDTPLQIRNEFRRLHLNTEIFQITSQQEFYPDLKAASKEAVYCSSLREGLTTAFGEKQFSYVYLERQIGKYEDWALLLKAVQERLAPKGYLLFFCENPFYGMTLYRMLRFSMPGEDVRYILMDPQEIYAEANKIFSNVQIITVQQEVRGIQGFAVQHYGDVPELPKVIQKMSEQYYYFLCKK